MQPAAPVACPGHTLSVSTTSVRATAQRHAADDVFLAPAEGWALVGAQPLAQVSNMALLPSLGALKADLNLTYGELGAVVAAFGLARLLTDLPAGGLARRWNPRSVLLVSFAVGILGSTLGALAVNAWQVAAVRLLIGVASSASQAMIMAWLLGGSGRAARGKVMACGEAFFSVAGLVIPALGGLLAVQLSWRAAFVLGALAAAIGFATVLMFTRASGGARSVGLPVEIPAPAIEPRDAARSVGLPVEIPAPATEAIGANPAHAPAVTQTNVVPMSGWGALRAGGRVLLAVYIAAFVVFFCRNGLLNAVVPVMGTDRLGLQPYEIGVLFSAVNALSIGVVLLGGRAGDRFGRYRLLAPGLAVLLVAQLLLFAVRDVVTYAAIALLQGVSFFVNPLPPGLLGDALPPRARAQGVAAYRAVSDLAVLSAPAAMGVALQLGGFPAAEFTSVLVIAVALIAVTLLAARRSAH